jgi:DNA repair exonuclease SbcCD ATPase subunit
MHTREHTFMNLRRTLAVAALSVLGVTGLAAAPASADLHCEGIEQRVADARDARNTAQRSFASYKSARHDKLVRMERTEARIQARTADRELKDVIKQIRKSDAADRKQLVKELQAERKRLAQANRVLRSDKALRAEIEAERDALKQAARDAQKYLVELQDVLEDCADAVEDGTVDDGTVDDGTVDDGTTGEETTGAEGETGTVAAMGKEN